MSSESKSDENNKEVGKLEWEKKLKQIKISKTDMNKLIMNYLCMEGYKDAALKFQQETTLPQNEDDLFLIDERKEIRQLIQDDLIDEAISKINDLNPEILETRSDLHFELEKQKLVGMIKENKIDEALIFAQEKLAPKAEENEKLLSEIEKVMGLLAFENPSSCPDSELTQYSARHKLASKVNTAILQSHCKSHQKKLPTFLKMLMWSQERTKDVVKIPQIKDITTGSLS